MARDMLAGILERMKIAAEVEVSEQDDKIFADIKCGEESDVQRIIGRHGQVVDALQHLVGKMIIRARGERGRPLVVDAGGYRQKQIERLEGLAGRMADKCLEQGRPVDLSPMSPHDRRIVHMAIAKLDGVDTRSEGEGDGRHVVVIPAE
jgi:spoIIIJ-associated protein